MKVIDGGVTAAKGFSAYGLRVGIKEGNTEAEFMLASQAFDQLVEDGEYDEIIEEEENLH